MPARKPHADVLLEEAGFARTFRTAKNAERTISNVRQHVIGHRKVVVGKHQLGHPGFRVEDLFGMGDGKIGFDARFADLADVCVRCEAGAVAAGADFDLDLFTISVDCFGASSGSAFSRTTSFAGLSSRRPLNAAWRTRLSRVQFEKEICATNSGLTQCTPRETPFGISAKDGLGLHEFVELLVQGLLGFLREAGTGSPRIEELAVFVVSDDQGANAGAAIGWIGETADDEFLFLKALRFDPGVAAR